MTNKKTNDIRFNLDQVRHCYDLTAQEYARRFFNELDHKPFDRHLLTWFASMLAPNEPVMEVGCGPGEIAHFLHGLEVNVSGLDLSPAMVAEARRLNPGIKFAIGDMLHLEQADNSLGAIVAFYAIVHFGYADVQCALQEWRRVVQPGGLVLLTFHIGRDILHQERAFEIDGAKVDFRFFNVDKILKLAIRADWTPREVLQRYPYQNVEFPSQRAYIVLQKTI